MTERQLIPAITGIGSAFGERVITNADIAQMLGKSTGAVDRMMRMSGAGIDSRYWIPEGNIGERTVTSDLAAEALQQAIEMSGIDPSTVASLVVATGTQDRVGVATAAAVQHKLNLPTTMQTYDIVAACPGYVHNLENAFLSLTSPYASPGPRAVIGAEIMSPMLNEREKTNMTLFADAAGATIVQLIDPDEGVSTRIGFAHYTNGQYAADLCIPGGGSYAPTTQETLDNNMHTLYMNSGVVEEFAAPVMASLAMQALDQAGIPIEEVDLLIPHQANKSIMDETVRLINTTGEELAVQSEATIEETAETIGISMEKVIVTIDHMGNTSSASIPTAMKEAWDKELLQRNMTVVFVSFGGGFNGIAAAIPMVGLPKR